MEVPAVGVFLVLSALHVVLFNFFCLKRCRHEFIGACMQLELLFLHWSPSIDSTLLGVAGAATTVVVVVVVVVVVAAVHVVVAVAALAVAVAVAVAVALAPALALALPVAGGVE